MAVVTAAGGAAHAQTMWTDRGFVNVSGFFQPSAGYANTVHPIDFAEAAVVGTDYKTGAVPGLEAGGGVRVWRNLAVGIDVSRFSKHINGSVSAQVPHPFFFGKPRSVSGDAAGLSRGETGVHLQALWLIPMRPRWELALAGGPSWFSVDQDLVSDLTVTQTYPFDTATFSAATSVHRSRSKVGFNAAADVSYLLRPHVGVGFGITFAHASVPLDDTLTVDAGGPHLAGGVRFRF